MPHTSQAVPKTLYHATYRPLLDSILAHGLGNPEHRQNRMWSDSEPDKVYLACDKYVAIGFAETSEFLEDESWIDDIVVLAVKTADLDHSKFEWDKNILDNDGYSWAYRGIISADHLSVLEDLLSEDEENSAIRKIVL